MTIASFDRHTCRTVQEGALKALEAYAASIGLKVSPGRGKFGPTSFTMQIEFAVVGGDGMAQTKAAADYEAARRWNPTLPPLGTKVQSSRFGELTIIGYNFKAKSMPVQLVTADGRGVKMAVEGVRA